MDILAIIQKHGESTHTLSKKMGIKQSTLMGMIKGNPTVSTLRKVSEGLGCQVAEFFSDELKEAGMQIVSGSGGVSSENPGVFRCPNCGCGVVMEVRMVQPPTVAVSSAQTQEQPSAESSDGDKQSDELPFKDGEQ